MCVNSATVVSVVHSCHTTPSNSAWSTGITQHNMGAWVWSGPANLCMQAAGETFFFGDTQ